MSYISSGIQIQVGQKKLSILEGARGEEEVFLEKGGFISISRVSLERGFHSV